MHPLHRDSSAATGQQQRRAAAAQHTAALLSTCTAQHMPAMGVHGDRPTQACMRAACSSAHAPRTHSSCHTSTHALLLRAPWLPA